MSWYEQITIAVNRIKKLRTELGTRIGLGVWRHYKEAYYELFLRYKSIFQFWWQRRDQIDLPDLKAHEAEFLPSALSLQFAPVSPAGRLVARILTLLLLSILLWSILGRVDIIVNGQGKIIAGGYTKTISSVEVAKVLGLYVSEGQHVNAGDLLIELDARGPDSEQHKAQSDRQLAILQMEIAKALLRSTLSGEDPLIKYIEGVNKEYYENEVGHLQDTWRDYMAKRARIKSQINRFNNMLPLVSQRAQDYAALASDKDVSMHAYFEKEQARIDILGQLEDAKAQLVSLTAEIRKTAQSDLNQATRILSNSLQDINKAAARSEGLRITSSVDGIVQQLTVHTTGGAVPAAQPLMLIVPDDKNVELEAYIENKDIGFVRTGQEVQVKIDAYEYSKYGTIPAIVTQVSRDAVDFSGNGTGQLLDKDAASSGKGLMYKIKISVQKPNIFVDGKDMPLLPGMSCSVEIKTGERRIIEYVISPLVVHARESLRER